jgi:ABC-type sugar transport system permease subunit/outer membrane protein assembly factor BamB
VAWLAVAIVIANAAFMVAVAWLGNSSQLEQRLSTSADQVVANKLLSSGDVLVAKTNNEIELIRDGQVAATAQIEATVHDVAEASDGYLVASGAGVHLLDTHLQELALLQVTGTAVAVADTDAGPVVAHGVGQFSDQYWVSRFAPDAFDQDAPVEPIVSQQAPFDITAMTVADGVAYYGTGGSHVGAVDVVTGELLWSDRAPYEVRGLLAPPGENILLVSNRNGGLTLFTTDGVQRGTVTTQNYEATAVGYDPETGSLLVGDFSGRVHIFDERGDLRLTQRFGESAIRGLHTLPDSGVLVVPRTGQWALMDLDAIDAVSARGTVVTAWVLSNVVALMAMVSALVVTSNRRKTRTLAILKELWRTRTAYMFILAAVVMVAYFFYVPTGMAVFQSFTDFSLRSTTEWVGLENYRRAFTDPYVGRGVFNMFLITVTGFMKTITVPLIAAELVYWLRNNAHSYFFRTAFVWASIPPGIVTILLWRMIYDPFDGLLNNTLEGMGLEGLTRAWLGDADTAIWAIIFMGFPWLSVFAFLIFLGGMMSINRELYDSAAIDGVSMWQRFRFIDLAHLIPQFRILIFLSITGAIETFAGILILTKGGPGYATYVPALQMYFNIGFGELGYASTIGVLLSILSLIAAWFILRWRRKASLDME